MTEIQVDDDYIILVDQQNWIVTRIMTNKTEGSKNKGKKYERSVTYHHDLGRAIDGIIQDRIRKEEPVIESLPAYLAWYESTLHSITDRVLRQKKRLKEALELNKVM